MPEKILIVDDEPDMLKLLSMILREKTPYEVTTTNNPVEAVELAKKGDYDLVITDLKMPGLDGLQLLEEVKKRDEDVPVIIITAYGTIDAAQEAIEKGGFDFITKPFKKEQILFTIEKALKWLRVQRENKMLREKLKGNS
ncbi:response regulator receiver domain-containing protein [Thermodesulfovibrio aggregans]|uniref:Response regulator receiver domain-containing protein n=1 Tax=Thermodesulfovibrio aggregans TaxID=86166 RepID=A0A0U9HL87_9BACT|nr:response regulator [Thermodesulfovibrio aggregans]GAQ93852.1 response regulator receiver domain-containing protein [Thermodesulfovibrio aggregans]